MKYGPEIVFSALLTFTALLAAAFAVDEPFRLHMWIAFFVLLIFTVVLLRNTSFEPEAPVDKSAYMDGPIRYGVIAREEAYLERKFGTAYLDYKSRVRRWL